MPLQWRNQIWQSLEEGAGKRCSGCGLLPAPYQYPNLSEGADRVGGLLRGDKECPFSGVTKSGKVWRKVPESDARSVVPLTTSPFPVPNTSHRSCVKHHRFKHFKTQPVASRFHTHIHTNTAYIIHAHLTPLCTRAPEGAFDRTPATVQWIESHL